MVPVFTSAPDARTLFALPYKHYGSNGYRLVAETVATGLRRLEAEGKAGPR